MMDVARCLFEDDGCRGFPLRDLGENKPRDAAQQRRELILAQDFFHSDIDVSGEVPFIQHRSQENVEEKRLCRGGNRRRPRQQKLQPRRTAARRPHEENEPLAVERGFGLVLRQRHRTLAEFLPIRRNKWLDIHVAHSKISPLSAASAAVATAGDRLNAAERPAIGPVWPIGGRRATDPNEIRKPAHLACPQDRHAPSVRKVTQLCFLAKTKIDFPNPTFSLKLVK
jgi:hypothetical protein